MVYCIAVFNILVRTPPEILFLPRWFKPLMADTCQR